MQERSKQKIKAAATHSLPCMFSLSVFQNSGNIPSFQLECLFSCSKAQRGWCLIFVSSVTTTSDKVDDLVRSCDIAVEKIFRRNTYQS
ncbi:hypothetical protein HMPREF0189_00428 [Burkholderiales bacterium 1_1_47]|nr:hypothetical protein HMPREF0189_00428 [Burkholderiales bacterium 1_1_47]DAW04123.1 MAG TPA: hypothetical protein [Caudoviricetes sp.]